MDDVLNAYVYEIKKGTKPMALLTVPVELSKKITDKIKKNGLSFCVREVGKKHNIFFGSDVCIDIVRSFQDKKLSALSPQEDFILGIMLGYNRVEQCSRYLNKIHLHPIG